jgi:hypothetical protein
MSRPPFTRGVGVGVVLVLALACLGASPAGAAPRGKPEPAVAQLEAAYAPIRAAAAADRVRRACADAGKLRAAAAGLPKAPPAGAAIDDEVWRAAADGLGLAVEKLVAACQAPDLKVKMITGKVETAEQRLARVDEELRGVLAAAGPRDLPPAMKRFATTFVALRAELRGKRACALRDELAKLLAGLEIPPPRADTQQWEQAHALVERNLAAIQRHRCRGARGPDEELADAIAQVHDGFYQLVVLVPPRDD